ncbi:DUF4920 domain-containing protein [Flavobacterium sp.]|uniref:DUF4920 domain-containing protein n=1 Tax=Flavobacterium sp. TaxID=239 RepID=UPI0026143962|nr:DUF4920 domain-containing protein [Flavobacterium sp.]
MKKIILMLLILVSSANAQNKTNTNEKYASFGAKISKDGAISKEQMTAKYAKLKAGDTIKVKFSSKIVDVCSKKGCWMNLQLGKGKSAFVKFKDYAFFMPLNSAGSEVIVNGKAFVSVESVAELRHYAKDAGKSKAEIEKITKPETSYSFEADGVLIKE